MNLRAAKYAVCAVFVTVAVLCGDGKLCAAQLLAHAGPPPPLVLSFSVQNFADIVALAATKTEHVATSGYGTTNMVWNTNSLIYGAEGFTAIGCYYSQGGSQVQHTALTRREVYSRGHDSGPDGLTVYSSPFPQVAYVTADNSNLIFNVLAKITRAPANEPDSDGVNNQDYTISLLDRDLPTSITPMTVLVWTNYNQLEGMIGTCQHNDIGFVYSANSLFDHHVMFIGGDSGAPNMLLVSNVLYFVNGRTTTGYSPQMQADINTLTTWAGLDTNSPNYQPTFFEESDL